MAAADVAEIVEFTRGVVAGRVGDVPIFALSARAGPDDPPSAAGQGVAGFAVPELTANTPEQIEQALRGEIAQLVEQDVHAWFDARHDQLRDRLEHTVTATLGELHDGLRAARSAAGELLALDMAPLDELAWPAPFAPPRFDDAAGRGWEELVSATLARHLPTGVRRRRARRGLHRWVRDPVPRPYGQARAGLQRELETAIRSATAAVEAQWSSQLAALQHGLRAVEDTHARSDAETDTVLSHLDQRARALSAALALLEP